MTPANPIHIVRKLPRVIGSQKVFFVAHAWLAKKRAIVEDIQPENAGIAAGAGAGILEDRVEGIARAIGKGDLRGAQGLESTASYGKDELVG